MNAFYQRYFLLRKGFELPSEDEWVNDSLGFMVMPDLKAEFAAQQLGVSPLWLTAVPTIFTNRMLGMYIGSGKLLDDDGNCQIKPGLEGLIISGKLSKSQNFRDRLDKIMSGQLDPQEVPPARPYAVLRAAARLRQVSVESYIRQNFPNEDRLITDDIIRDVILAGCRPAAGTMEICDQGIIRKLAEVEDITIDEACSGLEIVDENCFINLLIAYRLCIATPTLKNKKDGTMIVSYPGYKMSDFGVVGTPPAPKSVRQRSEMPPLSAISTF